MLNTNTVFYGVMCVTLIDLPFENGKCNKISFMSVFCVTHPLPLKNFIRVACAVP